MSSENGFTGGRENGAGGTAGTQTPLAGGRNTAFHLDMLTKDWNEKLAQALEQRISGRGKDVTGHFGGQRGKREEIDHSH